MVEGFGCGGWI